MFPTPAGRGEPPARRVRPLLPDRDRHLDASLPASARRGARAARADLRAAAEAVRAARPPRRANVRRRAADGRDRTRADGRAARARDRRALARARTARRRAARRVPAPAERGGQASRILLVEQNALLAFDLCERAYVLEVGRLVLEARVASYATGRRCTARTSGPALDDDVPAARRRRPLDRIRVRARRHVPRPRVSHDRHRQLRAGRVRGDRRALHVPALRRHAARARGARLDSHCGVRRVDPRGRCCGLPPADDEPRQHHHHARRSVPGASLAAARVRRHPAQLSRHLRSRLERRRSPRPAAVRADRGRGAARGDRADPLPAPDDRRPGAGGLRGLPSRRRARRA